MAIVLEDWLARNEQRAYPLHDLATRKAESGLYLPEDILTDIHISVPQSAGKSVYVSSVGITPGLVSATFAATPNNPLEPGGPAPGTPVPIAAVRATRPVTPYQNIAIEALYPGVSGWVAFGTGANKQEIHLLFGPEGTWLTARCVRWPQDLPVTSVGKYGFSTKLKGLVKLSGSENIGITKETRIIGGSEQDVLVFALKVPTDSTLQDVLREFASPCTNRPAEGTCNVPGLISISGVEPDRDGNINIVFQEGQEIIGDSGDGLVIDYPVGLSEVCPPKDYAPYDPTDICESSESSSSSSAEPSSSSSAAPEPPGESSSSSSYCNDLSSSSLGPLLQEVSGEGLGGWYFGPSEADGGTRLITQEGALLHNIVNTVDRFRAVNNGDETVVSGVIRPTQTPSGEGHLISLFKSANNFFFGGMTVKPSASYPDGRFFIGRKASGGASWPAALGLGYNFLAAGSFTPPVPLGEYDYDFVFRVIRVSTTTATARIEVTWNDPVHGAQAYVSPYIPLLATDTVNFRVGMGAVLSPKTEFSGWCVEGMRIFTT